MKHRGRFVGPVLSLLCLVGAFVSAGDDTAKWGRTVLFGGVPGLFAGDRDNGTDPLGDGTAHGLEYAENAVT